MIAHQQDQDKVRNHLVPALPQPTCFNNNRRRKAYRTKHCRFIEIGLCSYGEIRRFSHQLTRKNTQQEIDKWMNEIRSEIEKKLEEFQNIIQTQMTLIKKSDTMEIENLKTKLISIIHVPTKDCSQDRERIQTNNPTSITSPTKYNTKHHICVGWQ